MCIQNFLRHIEPNNLAVILGSGASIDYICGTANLTDRLKLWDYYCVPTLHTSGSDILQWMKATSKNIGCTYYEGLFKQTQSYFNQPNSFLHFERLIYLSLLLDTISRKQKIRDDMASMYAPFLEFIKKSEVWNSTSTHAIVADHACGFILEQIHNAQKKSEMKLHNDPLNMFFLQAFEQGIIPQIFTLNYDTVPTFCGLSFETGFSRFNDDVQTFNPIRLWKAKGSPLFLQLHGSILFADPPSNDRDEFIGYLARYLSPETALDNRTVPMGGYPRQDGTPSTSNFMITGLRKAEDIIREPYASYFQKLYETLVNSDKWLFVGYGGADPHLNSIISRATKLREQLKKKTYIAHITYSPNTHFNKGTSMWEPGYPIYDTHADNMAFWVPNSVFQKMRGKNGKPETYFWIKENHLNIIETPNVQFALSFSGTALSFQKQYEDIASHFDLQKKCAVKFLRKSKAKIHRAINIGSKK